MIPLAVTTWFKILTELKISQILLPGVIVSACCRWHAVNVNVHMHCLYIDLVYLLQICKAVVYRLNLSNDDKARKYLLVLNLKKNFFWTDLFLGEDKNFAIHYISAGFMISGLCKYCILFPKQILSRSHLLSSLKRRPTHLILPLWRIKPLVSPSGTASCIC